MLSLLLSLALTTALPNGTSPATAPADSRETQANRVAIQRFADLFYGRRAVRQAFETYVSPNYIQHSPGIADGREAAIRFLSPMFARPGFRLAYSRPVVDGNMAVIFVHAGPAGGRGGAIVDIFRMEGGKIAEHWDVNQPVPPTGVNPHPLF